VDELYVAARMVLLDALEALGDHRQSLVLVGAQAVYLQVGEADLAVAPYTTDADLALNPKTLAERPALEQRLIEAGFLPKTTSSVGVWITHRPTSYSPATEVAVDLLVPEAVSPGTGRRSARLKGHDSRSARMVKGLEGVLVDADDMTISALDPLDVRSFSTRVAGPAALLMSKVFKIHERQGTDRLSDKDALDVYRLLRGTQTAGLAQRYRRMLDDADAGANATTSLNLLEELFGSPRSIGVEMTLRAGAGLVDREETSTALVLLAKDLLDGVR
jgi:hypothetical protein